MLLTLIAAFLDGEMFRLNSHPLTFDHLIVTGPTHHYHIRAIRKIHGCSTCSGQDPSQINHISLSLVFCSLRIRDCIWSNGQKALAVDRSSGCGLILVLRPLSQIPMQRGICSLSFDRIHGPHHFCMRDLGEYLNSKYGIRRSRWTVFLNWEMNGARRICSTQAEMWST